MASLAPWLTSILPRCELPIFRSTIRPSPYSAPVCLAQQTGQRYHAADAARSFFTSQRLRLRQRSGSQNYPGFRNETKDQRLVREHKLFDPYSSQLNNPLARLAGPESLKRRTTRPVSEASSADVERELLYLAAHSPPGARVLNLLDHLVAERREQPNASHYEALIHANASPDRGSANNVRDLLQEMDKNKVPMNVNTYAAVLRTLVVHPDVDLLGQVIDSCERMWISLDSEMLHFVSAAYLRADMPELAMEYFDLIEGDASSAAQPGSTPIIAETDASGKVELWLYVLFITHLTRNEDWEGVIRLCYRLNDDTSLGISLAMRQIDIPYVFWHWLLTRASGRLQHALRDRWVSLWVWDLWVHRAWIRPSLDKCKKMLTLCAKHGLHDIAESIMQLLEKLASEESHQRDNLYRKEIKNKAELPLLLNEAYVNAGPDIPRMTEREKRKLLPYWRLFEDDMGIENEAGIPMRIDPWASLPSEDDPGKAWPKVIWERQAERKMKEETDQNRSMAIQEKQPGEVTVAVRAWPGQLQDDLQALASLVAGETEHSEGEAQAETTTNWSPPFIAVDSNEHQAVDVPSLASTLDTHVAPSRRVWSDVNNDSVTTSWVTVPINTGTSVPEASRDDQIVLTPSHYRDIDGQFTQDSLSSSTPSQRQKKDSGSLAPGTKTEIWTPRRFFRYCEREHETAENG